MSNRTHDRANAFGYGIDTGVKSMLVNSSAEEYRLLKDHEGHFITPDGIHRLLAWASSRKEPVLAFIAGQPTCE